MENHSATFLKRVNMQNSFDKLTLSYGMKQHHNIVMQQKQLNKPVMISETQIKFLVESLLFLVVTFSKLCQFFLEVNVLI